MATRQTYALLARRTALRRTLVEKVQLWRPTPTSDGQGGVTTVLSHVATLPGKVEPISERAALIAQRLGQLATAVIVLPYDAFVAPGDELRVGSARYTYVGSDVGTTNAASVHVNVAEAR